MWTEQRLGEELHATLDRCEPAATGPALNAVLRRGRTRLRVQRAGRLGGIAAAVTAIGVGAAMLPATAPSGGTGPPAASGTPRPTDTPSFTSVAIAAPPAADGVCPDKPGRPSPPATGGIRPESEVVPAFEAAVTEIAAPVQVRRSRPPLWSADDPRSGTARGSVELDLTSADLPGRVELEAVPLAGTPASAADADAYVYAHCEAPQRATLADGTVLQLYPVRGQNRPADLFRTVRIYTARDHLYIVTLVGAAAELPLTTEQLIQIALRLAALG